MLSLSKHKHKQTLSALRQAQRDNGTNINLINQIQQKQVLLQHKTLKHQCHQ